MLRGFQWSKGLSEGFMGPFYVAIWPFYLLGHDESMDSKLNENMLFHSFLRCSTMGRRYFRRFGKCIFRIILALRCFWEARPMQMCFLQSSRPGSVGRGGCSAGLQSSSVSRGGGELLNSGWLQQTKPSTHTHHCSHRLNWTEYFKQINWVLV